MTLPEDDRNGSAGCMVSLHGTRHACILENINSSGARVKCSGFLQETWPGDECLLHLRNGAGELKCRVTGITASTIELQFRKGTDF